MFIKKRILDQKIAFPFQKTLDHCRRYLGTGSSSEHRVNPFVLKACSVQKWTKQETGVWESGLGAGIIKKKKFWIVFNMHMYILHVWMTVSFSKKGDRVAAMPSWCISRIPKSQFPRSRRKSLLLYCSFFWLWHQSMLFLNKKLLYSGRLPTWITTTWFWVTCLFLQLQICPKYKGFAPTKTLQRMCYHWCQKRGPFERRRDVCLGERQATRAESPAVNRRHV